VTNEDGILFRICKTYVTLLPRFLLEKEITLDKAVNYNFKIQLKAESLNEVVVLLKTSKKNNPALDILQNLGTKA
jgi:hypothetical protein